MAPTGAYVQLPSQQLELVEEGRARECNSKPVRTTFVIASLLGLLAFLALLFGSMAVGPSQLQRSTWQILTQSADERLEHCTPEAVPIPRVEDMTLDEKIGQMTQVDKNALIDSNDVTKYFIGSVLSGGGGSPAWGNKPEDWAAMIDNFQAKASKTRLKIPMIYGVDAVHGHNNVYGTTIFPHHVGLGATRNPDLVQAIGAAAAKEVAATGIRWAFSPAVSVCRDPRWGRCYESFSEQTPLVQRMTAEITGWQMKPTDANDPAASLLGDALVAATAKHFVGDGGTQGGKDEGNTMVSEEELRRVHLPPYYDAIARGVMTVMVSYSSWNGIKMHGNHYLINDVLKGELGFDGLVVSDWAALQQLPGNWSDQVRSAINAGLDMIMVPDIYKQFIHTLKAEVLAGRVPMSRIDDAVRRVLKVKAALGLFEDACTPRQLMSTIGSEEHRAVARRAVRESLVLLKNSRRNGGGASMFPLPVTPTTRILVAGSHAHNVGLQSGGWTIQWQGGSGNITKGTTVLEGIQEVARGTPGAEVEYVEQPQGDEEADYGIVVVGEHPYAEFMGDNQALQLDASAHAAIHAVCKKMACVVVLISGRPLQVNHILPKMDALVAAWLPGTEGAGIAEVLFGAYDFRGRLPVTWFRETISLPMTFDNSPYAPLFPFGYGLDMRGNQLPAIF